MVDKEWRDMSLPIFRILRLLSALSPDLSLARLLSRLLLTRESKKVALSQFQAASIHVK